MAKLDVDPAFPHIYNTYYIIEQGKKIFAPQKCLTDLSLSYIKLAVDSENDNENGEIRTYLQLHSPSTFELNKKW